MVGGLILSQCLTLFTTPVIYLYLDEFSARMRGKRARKRAEAQVREIEEQAAATPPHIPPLGEPR
jgi:hypothetical protein